MAPKLINYIGFGGIHGPKLYKFIGFGNIHGPKPYEFVGFGNIHGPKPHKFIGFGNIHYNRSRAQAHPSATLGAQSGPSLVGLWVYGLSARARLFGPCLG